jgi:hypothetical protein
MFFGMGKGKNLALKGRGGGLVLEWQLRIDGWLYNQPSIHLKSLHHAVN